MQRKEHANKLTGYRLLKKLGEGTSGEVWKVEKDNQFYALKMYKPGFESQVFAEFDTMQKIEHPNIVDEYEVGILDSRPCMVMDFLDGAPLTATKPTTLSEEQQEKIISSLASALHSAHEENIIHRDLKPDNVFLLKDGTVKVLDFGVSAPISYSPHTKILAGSYSYMSPEQLSGRVNFQGDIWSFGICLYEWYTGVHPYLSETLEDLAQKMLLLEVTPPGEYTTNISNKIEFIILKCLRTRLEDRYSSFKEILDDLKSDPFQNFKERFNKKVKRENIIQWLILKFDFKYKFTNFLSNLTGVMLLGFLVAHGVNFFYDLIKPIMVTGIFAVIIVFCAILHASYKSYANRRFTLKADDFLVLSVLAKSKDQFDKLLRSYSRFVKYKALRLSHKVNQTSHEILLKWFFKEGDLEMVEALDKSIREINNNNEISLAYQLHEEMELNQYEKAQATADVLLKINPSHSAALLSEKIFSNKNSSSSEVNNNSQFSETIQKDTSIAASGDYTSLIAREIIRNGSYTLPLLKGRLKLMDNHYNIQMDHDRYVINQFIIPTANYNDIILVGNYGQKIILDSKFIEEQINKKYEVPTIREKKLDQHYKELIQFRDLKNSKLWFEFLKDKVLKNLNNDDLKLVDKYLINWEASSTSNTWLKSRIRRKIKTFFILLISSIVISLPFLDSIPEILKLLFYGSALIATTLLIIFLIIPGLWIKIMHLFVGKSNFEKRMHHRIEPFFIVYSLLVKHYVNTEKPASYSRPVKTSPLSFDFEHQILSHESRRLFFFKKRKQLKFADVKSIKFTINNKKFGFSTENCIINEQSKNKIVFRFKVTDYEKYIPILSDLWADKIIFEDNFIPIRDTPDS